MNDNNEAPFLNFVLFTLSIVVDVFVNNVRTAIIDPRNTRICAIATFALLSSASEI